MVKNIWEAHGTNAHEGSHPAGYKIIKDKKMVVVVQTGGSSSWEHIKFVAYPKLEHIEIFRKAAKGVREGGEAEINPGAIGTLQIYRVGEKNRGPKDVHIHLDYSQSHFAAGEGKGMLPRSLATKYGGWRERCLREAVKFALENGGRLNISGEVRNKGDFKETLHKVCLEMGLRPVKTEYGYEYWKGRRFVVDA
ncbi:MAG: hypothetical protein ABH854_01795 [Candidatus Diapherotrites archaeon]